MFAYVYNIFINNSMLFIMHMSLFMLINLVYIRT